MSTNVIKKDIIQVTEKELHLRMIMRRLCTQEVPQANSPCPVSVRENVLADLNPMTADTEKEAAHAEGVAVDMTATNGQLLVVEGEDGALFHVHIDTKRSK